MHCVNNSVKCILETALLNQAIVGLMCRLFHVACCCQSTLGQVYTKTASLPALSDMHFISHSGTEAMFLVHNWQEMIMYVRPNMMQVSEAQKCLIQVH